MKGLALNIFDIFVETYGFPIVSLALHKDVRDPTTLPNFFLEFFR